MGQYHRDSQRSRRRPRRSGAVCNANHDGTAAWEMRITTIFPHQGGGECGSTAAIRGGQGGWEMRITMTFPHQGGGKCGRIAAIRGG